MRVPHALLLVAAITGCREAPEPPVPDEPLQAEPDSFALWTNERVRLARQQNKNADAVELTALRSAQNAEWVELELRTVGMWGSHRLRAHRDGRVTREGASAGWAHAQGSQGELLSSDYDRMNYLLETLAPNGGDQEWSYPVSHGLWRALRWKQADGQVRVLSDYGGGCPPEVLALMLSVEEAFRRSVWHPDSQAGASTDPAEER